MEKQALESHPPYRMFDIGDSVYFMPNNKRNAPWVRGTILTRIGDLHYEIRYEGRVVRRHVDHIRRGGKSSSEASNIKRPLACGDTSQEKGYSSGEVVLSPVEKSPSQSTSPAVSQNAQIERNINDTLSSSGGAASSNTTGCPETSTSELLGFETPLRATTQDESGTCEGVAPDEVQPPPAPRRSSRQRKRRVLFSP